MQARCPAGIHVAKGGRGHRTRLRARPRTQRLARDVPQPSAATAAPKPTRGCRACRRCRARRRRRRPRCGALSHRGHPRRGAPGPVRRNRALSAGPGVAILIVLAAVPIVTGLTIDTDRGGSRRVERRGLLKSVDDLVLIPGFMLLFARGASLPRHYRLAEYRADGVARLRDGRFYRIRCADEPAAQAAWQDFRWLGAAGWGMVLIDWIRRRRAISWAFGVLVGGTWSICRGRVSSSAPAGRPRPVSRSRS